MPPKFTLTLFLDRVGGILYPPLIFKQQSPVVLDLEQGVLLSYLERTCGPAKSGCRFSLKLYR